MITGHGDDGYLYGDAVKMNFSSNVCYNADTKRLKDYLGTRLDVISSYPCPYPYRLACLLAEREGVAAENVFVTAGVVDAVYLIAQTFSRMIRRCAVCRPAFSEYEDACRIFGYDVADMDDEHPCLRWICNPDNPTGKVIDMERLSDLSCGAGVTVIDCSYERYTLRCVTSPREGLNMPRTILLHSLTKSYAIPGLRVGYVTAAKDIIDMLRANYRPWAVNALAIEAALFLVEQGESAVPNLRTWLDDAKRLRNDLGALRGVRVHDSDTPFMMCSLDGASAGELKEYLVREHGMLIRDLSNMRGLGEGFFRVCALSREANAALVSAVGEFIGGEAGASSRDKYSIGKRCGDNAAKTIIDGSDNGL